MNRLPFSWTLSQEKTFGSIESKKAVFAKEKPTDVIIKWFGKCITKKYQDVLPWRENQHTQNGGVQITSRLFRCAEIWETEWDHRE